MQIPNESDAYGPNSPDSSFSSCRFWKITMNIVTFLFLLVSISENGSLS